MTNSNMHSQAGAWEQKQSPVGRVALIPTSVYITKKSYPSIKTLYANIFCLYRLFLYAYLRRDEGNPTYGFLCHFFGVIAITSYIQNQQINKREQNDTKHRIKL